MNALDSHSKHGAIELVEGAIWRVERKNKVDFLCKYVRPEKVDGKYLKEDIVNEMPECFDYLKKAFAQLVQADRITETGQKTSV